MRPSLIALLVLTGILYIWGLGRFGWANAFYSAAVQAGSESWKAFFFGSSDAANWITVDKTPASLWVMALSARIFGLNVWSILVPQALMGVATAGPAALEVRGGSGAYRYTGYRDESGSQVGMPGRISARPVGNSDIDRPQAGPEGGDMLSKQDSRRLAQLERQLWRDDPDFCARMAGDMPARRRVPISLALTAAAMWAAAVVFAVAGWWIAAAIAALWAVVIVCALAYRSRPVRRVRRRPADPERRRPGEPRGQR